MSKSTSLLYGLCGAVLLFVGGCGREADTEKVDESLEAIEAAIEGREPGEAALAADGNAAETVAGTDAVDTVTAAGDAGPVEEPAAPALGAGVPAGSRPADALPPDTRGDDSSLATLVDEDEIPYPVYPNGSKYRVGGENGLKIVLYETTDSFDEVDAYYRARSGDAGMPRLAGMSDYVRYGASLDDTDPWATHRPGIVIHRFADEGERTAVGAGESARTNIIISY